ncbi:YveK family protein [Streptomyces goshikiensis]|uniref:YveK family protein n=1 Tax=Streptomyces goshikiensis TaxID=1942 RepID=UPI0036D07415
MLHDIEKPKRTRRLTLPLWWPLSLCAALGLASGGAYGVIKIPEYAATSFVIAVPAEATGPTTAVGFAQVYARIATSDATLAYAQQRVGIEVGKLRTQVRTEASPDSPVIAVTGTSKSPAEAADIANVVADGLSLAGNQAAKATGVKLQVFGKALAPTKPQTADPLLSAAVGLCAGTLIGSLWVLARPRRKSSEQVLMDMALLSSREGTSWHRNPHGVSQRDGAPSPGLAPVSAQVQCRDPWHFTALRDEWDRPDQSAAKDQIQRKGYRGFRPEESR